MHRPEETKEERAENIRRQKEREAMLAANPLIQFSTTQLKQELRRRKKENDDADSHNRRRNNWQNKR